MSKKIFIISLLYFCLTFLSLSCFNRQSLTTIIDGNSLSNMEKTFELEPENKYSFYSYNQVPDVNIAPSELGYFYKSFTDKNIYLSSFSYVANSYISVLYKWGNILPIKKNLNNTNNLIDWWKSTEPTVWQFYAYNNYNSWEAVIAQYYSITDRYISYLKKTSPVNNTQAIELKAFLNTNKKRIEMIIYNLRKSDEDKFYLIDLSDNIYNSLNTKIMTLYVSPDPDIIGYPIDKIRNEKEFGLYDISFIKTKLPEYFQDKIKIITINKSFSSLENVAIDESTNGLLIKFPKVNLIEKETWYRTGVQRENEHYYYLNFSAYSPDIPYLISIKYKINDPLILQLEASPSDIILSELLLPHKNTETYLNTIKFTGNLNIKSLRFIIISGKIMSVDDLRALEINVQPLFLNSIKLTKKKSLANYSPKITYKRKNLFQELIKVEKTSSEHDNIIMNTTQIFNYAVKKKGVNNYSYTLEVTPIAYFYSYCLLLIYILTLFYISFSGYLYKLINYFYANLKLKSLIYHFIQLLLRMPKFSQWQSLIIVVTCLLILFDILLFPAYSFFMSLFIFLFYIISLAISDHKLKISLISPFILTILMILLLFFRNERAADKAAFWLTVSLIIYLLETIIKLNIKKNLINISKNSSIIK